MNTLVASVDKQSDVLERLKSVGITAKKIDASEALSKSWIIPSNDRKGLIKIKFFKKSQ